MEYSKYPHPNDRGVPRPVKLMAIAAVAVSLWAVIALVVL